MNRRSLILAALLAVPGAALASAAVLTAVDFLQWQAVHVGAQADRAGGGAAAQ